MRRSVLGEVVLELDEVGRAAAFREITGRRDPAELAKKQDLFAQRMWHLAGCPASWDRTITRLLPEEAN